MPALIQRTRTTNNTAILTTAGTALSANEARMSYKIQNLGTNPLFVKEGAGASTSDFTYLLAGATASDDGTGGSYDSTAGQVYSGIITFAGTAPRCIAIERTED